MAKNTISIDVVISDGKDGLKKLTLDADALRKIMEQNVKVAQSFERKVIGFAATATSITAVNNAFSQLASTMQGLTSESEAFNKAMRGANTMAGKDSAGFKQLKGEVADLAKEIPIARDQLADGLYQTISNGVPENNWIEFLNTSARSAVGGIADINKVVGVTATVIKNYGLEWSAAADIQDKIQLTAKNGVTSFEQLSQALPRVTGNAATLGVSIDELMGTFATLTGVSGNTAEVSTQLGAIFTALVKPSSEAAEMAAKMGIQFDAAAIKAAGGFQNFLTQLDSSVESYAMATGSLEQEVYGKLFGSAEAIRALIPLQGELSDKFAVNVANMVNSAGTMDAAYADMSSHGEAVNQMLRNQWAAFTDVISGAISSIQPFVNFSSGVLNSAASAAILITTFKQLNVQQILVATRAKLAGIAMITLGLRGKSTAAVMRVFSSAMEGGAYSATALKIALRGLLIATGIGAAIAAVTTIIEYFANATDDAADSTNKLLTAEERAKRDAEQLEQLRQQEASTLTNTRAALEMNISRLREFNGTKEQEKKLVNEMNNTYGDTMGYFSSVADWYDALISNSEAYCRQMVIEARTRMLANQIAQKEQENHGILYNDDGSRRLFSKKRDTRGEWRSADGWGSYKIDVEIEGSSDLEEAQATYDANIKSIKSLNEQLNTAAKEAAQISFSVRGSENRPENGGGKGTEKGTEKERTRLQQLNDLIAQAKENYVNASETEREEIRQNIAQWNNERRAIELLQKEAERPTELTSFQAIDDEIAYQQTLRRSASQESIAGIDAEIKRLERLRVEKERAGHTEVSTDELQTYSQLNDEVSYYSWLVQNGTEQERIFAQQHLNDLAKVKKAWDETLAELEKPGDVSALNTIEELDQAISYYQQKQKKAAGEEIQNIQPVIDAYEKKRGALQRGIEIPSMLREAEDINKLTGREYKVKISGMGFDELTAKINELNRMLNDSENPLTENQREDIESLIATYGQWRKEGAMAFDTFRSGYDNLKSIGSGVESLTGALEGNGNAWQTVTGIVDGFLQIYEGIRQIVELTNMLTEAVRGHAVAEQQDAAAVSTKTAATAADTAASAVNTTESLVNTGAKQGESIANVTAQGAKMPFPMNLIAIAAGVSAVIAAFAAIGSFATGGIVGGNSKTGDKLLARVNSGEMILNATQQRNLFRMINAPAGIRIPQYGSPDIASGADLIWRISDTRATGGAVTFRIDGRTLVGVLANETRIAGKSGRKTHIKL